MSIEPLTIPALERWLLFGATWRVVEISAQHATVDLCACTGETVERREAYDPAVIAYLREEPPAGDPT
jgi:hypothetical protein